jgi:hypothetical protein
LDESIEFEAMADTRFVFDQAIPHPRDLHLGRYSVHANPTCCSRASAQLSIGRELHTH